ncbi:MAG TPA: wax ester/triacylglycerol synthase family O-acyltransferase [Nocardioidaceae bacterium]|nr:wax ester/triacylglycerol synthase family O-acyltransferase [Nocardioidaceae bacterium]
MPTPMDPTSSGFLFAESRTQPMHVGGLQLFAKPVGAGRNFAKDLYDEMLTHDDPAPLFLKRPHRSLGTAGQWCWVEDEQFDLEYHVRHNALPKPGRVRELLELCSRLHGTRLALDRPLWEFHLIEGLRDGRLAVYTKMHHALVDGVSSMRLLQRVLSTDPDERDQPPMWSAAHVRTSPALREAAEQLPEHGAFGLPSGLLGSALSIGADAAGLPGALVRTLSRGVRNETSQVSLYAPRTLVNTTITGSRRFAAEDWPIERIRGVGRATGTTLNDVVLAMCSGAMRTYLSELGGLPEASLVAMVPVGLQAKSSQSASARGGNAVGAVMVALGTDLADPADRLRSVHESMVSGKRALGEMTPAQIVAMSALGLAPAVLPPMFKVQGLGRPPFNLVISNVPGPRRPHYFNGMRLEGLYPLSIPIHGMALNITCTSYDGQMGFGLTGCRRTVPHLQRLLGHLDSELLALERAAGL